MIHGKTYCMSRRAPKQRASLKIVSAAQLSGEGRRDRDDGCLQTCARRRRGLAGSVAEAELEICPRRQRLTLTRRIPCAHFPPLRAMIGSERPSEFRDAPFGQSRGDVVCCVLVGGVEPKAKKEKKKK